MKLIFLLIFFFSGSNVLNSQSFTQIQLPFYGNVKDIAISYSNPNIIMLVGSYGTFKSTDAGNSWFKVSNTQSDRIRISYINPNYVIKDYEKSTNGGQSWIPENLWDSNYEFVPNSDSTLYQLSATNNFQKSTDFAESWYTILPSQLRNYDDFLVHPLNSNLIYVLSSDTFYTSLDGGNTWNKLKYREYNNRGVGAAFLGFSDPNLIIFQIEDSLYKSTNGGVSFSRTYCPIYFRNLLGLPTQQNSIIGVAPQNWDAGYTIYKSNDLGANWVSKGLYKATSFPPSRIIGSTNGSLYIGYQGAGIFSSENSGEFWKSIGPFNLNIGYADRITVINDQVFYIDNDGNLYKTTNSGEDWTLIVGEHGSIYMEGKYGNLIYLTDFDKLHKTSDGGLNWRIIPVAVLHPSKIIVSSIDTNILIVGDSRDLARSTDGGSTWGFLDTPNNEPIQEIIMSDDDANRIFIRLDGQPNKLLKTDDLGNSWYLSFNDSGFINSYSVKFSKTSPSGFLANWNVYFSPDDGNTWNQVFQGTTGTAIRNIALDFNDKRLYAYNELNPYGRKLVVSNDSGKTWIDYSLVLPSNVENVYNLTTSPTSKIYALTNIGLFSGYLPTIDIKVEANEETESYLFRNYPNPFNSNTNFSFSIGKKSFVILKIFDVLGRELTSLVSEEKERGIYYLTFQPEQYQLSSGIYFYSLKAGDYSECRKMIFLK